MARHLRFSGDHQYRRQALKQIAVKFGIQEVDNTSPETPSLHILCSNSKPTKDHHVWYRNAQHKNFADEFKHAKNECKKYNLNCLIVHQIKSASGLTNYIVVTKDSGIQSFQSEGDAHKYLCEYVKNHKGY